jgi:hypothetical protein
MFRIVYICNVQNLPWSNQECEIQFTTGYAFEAYERWINNRDVSNVRLQQYSNEQGGWVTLKEQTND